MLDNLPDIFKAFSLVNSWDDLVLWFSALAPLFKWVVALGFIGVLVIIYIFIVAIFVDKES